MDPITDYYGMDMWQRMLGLSGNPYYQPPHMQYYGMGGGQQQGQKQQGVNPNMMRQIMAGQPTQTGMTPNATNASGESYYGWGAQTGDWGASGNGLIAGNEIGAGSGAGAGEGAAAGAGGAEGGVIAGAAPYAALAAAMGAFKLNSDWMAQGKGNHDWFKTMWDESFNEMFGTEGLYGLIKGLF